MYLANRQNFFYRHILPSSNYVCIPEPRINRFIEFTASGKGFFLSYSKGSIIDVEALKYSDTQYNFEYEDIYCFSESQQCLYARFQDKLHKLSSEKLEILASIAFPSRINLIREVNNKIYVLENGKISVLDVDLKQIALTVGAGKNSGTKISEKSEG